MIIIKIKIFYFIFIIANIYSQNIPLYLKLLEQGKIDGVKESLIELESKYPNNPGVLYLKSLLTEDGERYYQLALNDISSRRQELQKLALQADFDALTGIYNRNGGEKLITKLMKKDHQFALTLIDLNGFKAVNDIYGHDAGDEVLIFVAEQLKEKIRKNVKKKPAKNLRVLIFFNFLIN